MDNKQGSLGSKSRKLPVVVGAEWEGLLEVEAKRIEIEAKRLELFRPLPWAVALVVVALAVRVLCTGDVDLLEKLLTYVKDITLVAFAAIAGWRSERGSPESG